jgi:hypothetical protein
MARVGDVHYLAADPVCRGLEGIAGLNDFAARGYPRMHQSAPGLEARFASILPLAVVTLFSRDDSVLAIYRRHAPDDVAVAQRIVDEDLWPSKRLDLDGAVRALAPILVNAP